MEFYPTPLTGNYLINLDKKEDDRGFFARCFCQKEFLSFGLNVDWVQVNNSFSKKTGTLRGLHFQYNPYSEVKLVKCLKGAIWDVVVDLRIGSKTFGKWYGSELSDENGTMMYVPKGFAHGFITLKKNTEILYLVSEFYSPNFEGNLIWNDPDISIKWPINPTLISNKDKAASFLKDIKSI